MSLPTDTPALPWYREWQAAALVVLMLLVHFTRLEDVTLRGEETRRGQVAVEMIRTGDWIVPREQGQLFLSRPPLQNWLIALVGMARGEVDAVAIRLPSAIATLLICLLVYAYSRRFLSALGALAAGAAYGTLGHVLELGHLGETESIFTLLVGGSLLVWHWGYTQNWPPLRTWCAAYLLVALGTLAKGPQAPVYFAACVGGYLLLERRPWFALSFSHAAGILLALIVWGAWQVPYTLTAGWPATMGIYGGDVAMRFEDNRWTTILENLATYPLETFACLLPWSVFLINFAYRGFRQSIGQAWPMVRFLAVCLLVTYPTVWFPPGSQSRYFMPLYPCVAPLVGLVIARSYETAVGPRWQKAWNHFAAVMAVGMAVAGIVVLTLTLLGKDVSPVAQPPVFAAVYLVGSLALAVIAFRTRLDSQGLAPYVSVLSVAAFAGLTFTGVYTNALRNDSNDVYAAVSQVQQKLPAEAKLVSLGFADHRFAYRYRQPIKYVAWPGHDLPAGVEYFCFVPKRKRPDEVPFAWEQVATVSLERTTAEPSSNDCVVIGRKIPQVAEQAPPRR